MHGKLNATLRAGSVISQSLKGVYIRVLRRDRQTLKTLFMQHLGLHDVYI